MIRVCYRCKIVFGEKEPLEDKRETHGICKGCFPKEIEDIERFKKVSDQLPVISHQSSVINRGYFYDSIPR